MTITTGTDTYLDVDEAATYFQNRLHSQAWAAATDPDRENALRTATTLLDALDYHGARATSSQSLAWPRRGMRDRDGCLLPFDAIPAAIPAACAEWAIHLLTHDPTQPAQIVTRKQVGDLWLEFAPSLPDTLPALVRVHLAPYLRTGQNVAQIVP